MEANEVSYAKKLMMRNAENAEYQSQHHFISKSASHTDMWIFKGKFDNSFFTLNASEEWIARNSSILDTGKRRVQRKPLTRRNAV